MSKENQNRLKDWLASGEARLQPLSFSQRELWEASPVPPGDVTNHICTFMEVRGAITPEQCVDALRQVVDRQEVLRLSILPGKEQPLQLIRKTLPPVIRFCELSDIPESLEDRMRAVFAEPFDLLRGPLYRVEVIRRGPDDLVLVFVIHHAIADGWTLGVFVEDLFAAYLQTRMGVTGGLPAVPLAYTAWAAVEREQWSPAKIEERGKYWKQQLAGAPRLWETTSTGPRTLTREVTFFPADLAQGVRDLARRSEATLFSTLLTAFQLALSEWSGTDDIVVGTPFANRTRQTVRETMGYCSGNVPIRATVHPDRPFEDNVRATHQSAMDAFSNAMPFAELLRAVGEVPTAGRNPIFDVRFALQNHPLPVIAGTGMSAKLHMRSTGTARFDLGCEVTESGDELEIVWLHRPEVISSEDLEAVQSLFRKVIEEIAQISQRPPGILVS